MKRRMADQRGQSAVMTLLFLTVLLGMCAAVVDVGAWFRAHRSAQAEADAAALAAAQALPADPANATVLAVQYANKNGGGVTAADVQLLPSAAVRVDVRRDVPGVFSKVLGFAGVRVHAHGTAKAYLPGEARWVAPIVVKNTHPLLFGPTATQSPTFDVPTTLTLGPQGAPGAFSMLNLDENQQNGTIGTSTLAEWIEEGFDQYLEPGQFYSDPGAKFNSSQIQSALQDRYGTELLFPVYDTLVLQGSTAEYHVIGWVGFHITSVTNVSGTGGSINGWFTRYIADGIDSAPPAGTVDMGVRSIQLID
jgi:Flp pilus assembly protein TadG